jgi:hypothetical protein
MATAILKRDLLPLMYRFLKDKNRGISVKLFAELAGVNSNHLLDVFFYHTEPLTERMQRRVSKAFLAWQGGEVAIMQNPDRTKFVEYRKQAKPVMVRHTGLQVINGEIKMQIGLKPKYDYSQESLDEQIKRG